MSAVRFEISMSLDGYVTASGVRPDEPMGEGGQVLHEMGDIRSRLGIGYRSTEPLDLRLLN